MVNDYFPEELDAPAGSSGSSCGRRAQTCGLNDCYWLAETTKSRRTTEPGTSCVCRTVRIWISRIVEFVVS
jgi:hypothetical protein